MEKPVDPYTYYDENMHLTSKSKAKYREIDVYEGDDIVTKLEKL